MTVRQCEIEQNYQFFQSMVSSLMQEHAGKFALLHSCELVDVFPRPMDAMTEGYRRFTDGQFSVQQVTDRPVDLGFLSYATDNGITA